MNHFLRDVRDTLKDQTAPLLKSFGIDLLSVEQTGDMLQKYLIYNDPAQPLILHRVTDVLNPDKVLFEQKTISVSSASVWNYPSSGQKASLLRNGSVRINRSVLNTDFGNTASLKDVVTFNKRRVCHTNTLIAPWSHFWGGYYDYLIFIVAKLCRIKKTLSDAEFSNSLIAYPLLNTIFESELLTLLGFRPENVIDSQTTDVHFSQCIVGNSGNWFYPNVADLIALKTFMETKMPAPHGQSRRLYISRAGRRRVVHEDALVRLLEGYGFDIIEDKPRTISEQYQLYSNASFIIGPHGASFANILWCQPGTHLFELFPPDYMPEYFRYMAQLLGLPYHGYCLGDGSESNSHHSNMHKDVLVSIDELDSRLNQIFATQILR